MWLGWQVESNWTDPWLFAVYVVAKPLAGSLLIVFMYLAAGQTKLLPFSYLGNAVYMLVGSVGFGMSSAVVTDRENYGMLKYVRISPIGLQSYLIGRGLAQSVQGTLGAVLTIAAGLVLPLGLYQAIDWGRVEWGWLALYLVVGMAMLLSVGLILGGVVLNMARHGYFLSEGVGSACTCSAGQCSRSRCCRAGCRGCRWPCRRRTGWKACAVAAGAHGGEQMAGWDHPSLALALIAGTAVLAAAAQVVFRWAERRAQRRGPL